MKRARASQRGQIDGIGLKELMRMLGALDGEGLGDVVIDCRNLIEILGSEGCLLAPQDKPPEGIESLRLRR